MDISSIIVPVGQFVYKVVERAAGAFFGKNAEKWYENRQSQKSTSLEKRLKESELIYFSQRRDRESKLLAIKEEEIKLNSIIKTVEIKQTDKLLDISERELDLKRDLLNFDNQ